MADSLPLRFASQEQFLPRRRLREESVTIVGVGGIGRQIALQLTALGVPKIRTIDPRLVQWRHVTSHGFRGGEVGHAKVDAVGGLCHEIEPQLNYEGIAERFRPDLAVGTSVFSCVDSRTARIRIFQAVRDRSHFFGDAERIGSQLQIRSAVDEPTKRAYLASLVVTKPPVQACFGALICDAALAASLLVYQYTRYLRDLPLDVDLSFDLVGGRYLVADRDG